MKNALAASISAACIVFGNTVPVHAQAAAAVNSNLDALFGEHSPYQEFLSRLKTAVSADDRATVASMVAYPLSAHIAGTIVKIRDAQQFEADYDRIITDKVKSALVRQTYATLFANWQGVAIGDGTIWFSGVGKANSVKIISIND